jgi:hypothetical protein
VEATATLTVAGTTIHDNAAVVQGGGMMVVDATVTMEDSTVLDNAASLGGGFSVYEGSLAVADSVIDGNAADNGGGIAMGGGAATASITASQVSNNTATNNGGGLWSSAATVALNDTLVELNQAANGAGAYVSDAGSLACTGSPSVVAGFLSNVATTLGGGVALASSATLTSTSCDWGTTGEENTPEDVYASTAYAAYAADETFTCTSAGCP